MCLEPRDVVDGNKVFTEFKGALTEQYVCQQLASERGLAPCCWSAENSSGEIDFLVQDSGYTIAATACDKRIRTAATIGAFDSGRVRRNGFLDGFLDGIPGAGHIEAHWKPEHVDAEEATLVEFFGRAL